MAEQSRRFVSLDKPIDKFIEDQRNKNTLSKTRRDISLLTELRSDKLNFIGLPILDLLPSLFSNEKFHI